MWGELETLMHGFKKYLCFFKHLPKHTEECFP